LFCSEYLFLWNEILKNCLNPARDSGKEGRDIEMEVERKESLCTFYIPGTVTYMQEFIH
jgi:hypothetical protein